MNLTDEQLNKIFELASMNKKINVSEATSKDISEALISIERKLFSFTASFPAVSLEDKRILIADDLELSIFQLSTLLRRTGVSPYIARSKDEAIAELHKAKYDCIIVDLFIPDSEDGLELIRFAQNKRNETGVSTKIIVISGTDDKSLIDKCYEQGADLYIQKDTDWHNNLLKYMGTIFRDESAPMYTRYNIRGNTVLFKLQKFNDNKVFSLVKKDVMSAILTGTINVIFDLQTVNSFDNDNAYIFADIYKMCAESGGKFVIVNPTENIGEALAFAFLEGIIPVFDSVESATDNLFNPDEEKI